MSVMVRHRRRLFAASQRALAFALAVTIIVMLWSGGSPVRAAEEMITGTAMFPTTTVVPENAVFEAVLQDVSRAEAPAQAIARTRIEHPGPTPIAFSIAYDPAAIDERHTYVVRSRILSDDRMILTSDTVNPVLTRGASREVAVTLRPVAPAAKAAPGSGDDRIINGMFVYMADAARLTECRTGDDYPVAMAGGYLRLEQSYLDARQAPGQALMVSFVGGIEARPRMDGDGTEPTVVVTRFINVWPGETCERNRADASLTNTYWRIVRLGGAAVDTVDGRREPHLLLRGDEPRFSATVGCNQLAGGFTASGASLRFSPPLSTRMACPPPLDRSERDLAGVLTSTTIWHIAGQILELRDADGQPLALLQAVYLH